MLIKTIHEIWMFSNQLHAMKIKNEVTRSLVNSESFAQWLKPNLDILLVGMENGVKAILSFFEGGRRLSKKELWKP